MRNGQFAVRFVVGSMFVVSIVVFLIADRSAVAAANCSALAPCAPQLPSVVACDPAKAGAAACASQETPATGIFKKYQGPEDLNKQIQSFFAKFPGSRPTVDGISMPVTDPGQTRLGSAELYKKLTPSVLYVLASNGTATEQGSAVAITPDVAMTDCHVVMYGDGSDDDSSTVFTHDMPKITITDSTNHQMAAEIILRHPEIDICLIRPLFLKLTPVPAVVPFSALEIGEPVYALGNPEGFTSSLTSGLISQLRLDLKMPHAVCANVIQFSAPVSPGSSGGALLDHVGRLVGITQSSDPSGENLNIAIPASLLWDRFANGTPVASTCS